MTAPRVTSCPHCNTSFRITQTQLRAANGSVRCGSCLQVFDASSSFKQSEVIPAKATVTEKDSQAKTATAEPSTSEKKQIIIEPAKPESPPPPVKQPSKEIQKNETENKTHLDSIFDELGEQEDQLNHLSRLKHKRNIIWGCTALMLGLLLVVQYGWFNRDSLSLNPRLRPVYQWSCQTLGCSLPPLVDIQSIKSLQLLVRTHPDINNALLVDAVIINNADHGQPYPTLELSFTDINGNLVANRKFYAREYLAGELAGSKQMPIRQPIRLALEIIDPGQDAVNYSLSFSANKTP